MRRRLLFCAIFIALSSLIVYYPCITQQPPCQNTELPAERNEGLSLLDGRLFSPDTHNLGEEIVRRLPVDEGEWVDITGNLPDTHINDIAPFSGRIYVGTNLGAYVYDWRLQFWQNLNFAEKKYVRVTQIEATLNPWVNCICAMICLGAEECTAIPEDRNGRIFFSFLDGETWEDTHFPDITVSALEMSFHDRIYTYAAAYNPSYYHDGLYQRNDSTWTKIADFTPGDTSIIRINCITAYVNILCVGTEQGLFITRNGGKTWTHVLENVNVVSLIFHRNDPEILYAATAGESSSDGIYRSTDGGSNWELLAHFIKVTGLVQRSVAPSDLYLGTYGQGVMKSTDGGETWLEVNQGLKDKKVTSLADVDWPGFVSAGTEGGMLVLMPPFLGMKGDIDGSGRIDVIDVVLLVNLIVGLSEPVWPEQFLAADYNNDGILNVLDVVLLINEIIE